MTLAKNGATVRWLAEILPQELGAPDAKITVPDWAFTPDQWSAAFLRGLFKLALGWSGKKIWEVGVGTGINLLALRNVATRATWYFSDYDPRCVPLAIQNLQAALLGRADMYYPLHGAWDLVSSPDVREVPTVDVIFCCLPQVPAELDLRVGDNFAHYYCPTRYPNSHLHPCGLGLVEELLRRAKRNLSEGGQVVLNLGGRPGLPRLVNMFHSCGYHAELIHQEVIAQHAGTSLASLAALEEGGHADFEFFTDASCNSSIHAREAEDRRVKGESLYHKIYVMAGKPK